MDSNEPIDDKTNMLYSYNQVDIKPRNYSVTSEEEVEKTEFVNFGGYNGASTETTFGVGKIPSGKFVAHMDTCKVIDNRVLSTKPLEDMEFKFVYICSLLSSKPLVSN
mgnify:CR=1 FL=1